MQLCHCYYGDYHYSIAQTIPTKDMFAGLIVTPQPGTSNPLVITDGTFIRLLYNNESKEKVPYHLLRTDQGTAQTIQSWYVYPGTSTVDFDVQPGTYIVSANCPSSVSCDTTIILMKGLTSTKTNREWFKFEIENTIDMAKDLLGLK